MWLHVGFSAQVESTHRALPYASNILHICMSILAASIAAFAGYCS